MWYTLPSAPYSWIKVNVGLDTSSCSATPRPRTIPLAGVVLVAPRLPINSTPHRRATTPPPPPAPPRPAVPRQSGQVNRRRYRLVRELRELRHQGRDEPGE